MNGWTSAFLIVVAALGVGACTDQAPERQLADYLVRIGRITNLDVELPPAEPLKAYPPRRALLIEIPRRTINVIEFFQLGDCNLGALVGFRNSPLGRVQSPSQRLGYETAWLAAAEACGAGAADWLPEIGAEKRERLPALFWNATFAAEEMRVALGSSAAPREEGLANLLRALADSLGRAQQGGFEAGEFEALLGELRRGSWVGPARHDWQRWRRYLDAAAALLEQATPRVCLNRRPTGYTDRLANVFLKFYVERLQPELSAKMTEQEQWVAELERLGVRLDAVAPEEYLRWYREVLAPAAPESEWRRTRQAVVRHAEAWQGLFAYCNVEPVSGLSHD